MRKQGDVRAWVRNNAVTVMFVLLCIICIIYSGQSMSYVIYEMFGRLSRNAFIVLALIIPIVAGMGINFAITIGAMAAQIAALWVIEWGVGGFGGFLLAMLMTMPIAGLFGFLIGKLLNKMKGQEMIGGLILGYFANGLYQLLFLFIFGNLIPLNTPGLVIKGSTGVANTIDLTYGSGGGIKYALDGLMPGTYTVAFKRVSGMGFTRLRPELDGGSWVVELLDGFGQTEPMEVTMGALIDGMNAGMLPASTVTGQLFHDANDNGLWDDGETGMTGATVRLLSEDGETDWTRTVDENGNFLFDGVMPGTYQVTYQLPEHTVMARTAENGNTQNETETASFKVEMGTESQLPLAGAVELGSLSGVITADANGQSLAGATVTLTPDRASAEEATVQTGADGSFQLENLRPAQYRLTVELPEGWIFSGKAGMELTFAAAQQQTLSIGWQALVSRDKLEIGAVKPASVSGDLWLDENKDGIRQTDEQRLSGVTLELVNPATGGRVAAAASTEDGFRFDNVRPGTYLLRFELPAQAEAAGESGASFRQNGSRMEMANLTVKEGEEITGISAGLVSKTSIGGKLALHLESGDSPVAGAEVRLYQAGEETALQTVLTGEDGSYRFDGLWPGEYEIESDLPAGMIFVRQNDPNFESGATIVETSDETTGRSGALVLEMAKHRLNENIWFIEPAKVGDQAWLDENGNGLMDGGERMLPGVKVSLWMDGVKAYETETNAAGYYLFDQVYPGTYTLQAEAYPELEIAQSVEGLRLISNCLTAGDGTQARSEAFQVESGSVRTDFKLGYVLREGESLPEGLADEPKRDWTESYQKYQDILGQQR